MYDEQQAIIREIVARPDDDLPRLIYADWLDERGDPQGEFIRIQCALARGEQSPDETRELRERETELLRAYRGEWVARLGPGVIWHQIYRGLIEDVAMDCEAFFRDQGVLLANCPVIGLAMELRSPADAQALANLPTFVQLQRLRLNDSVLEDRGLQALAMSPHAPRLLRLWLLRCQIGLEGVQALATSPMVERLELLSLYDNDLGEQANALLREERVFRQIRLRYYGLPDQQVSDPLQPRF